MKPFKLILEAGIMAAALLLVIITMSGWQQTVAIFASVLSILFFLVSNSIDEEGSKDE